MGTQLGNLLDEIAPLRGVGQARTADTGTWPHLTRSLIKRLPLKPRSNIRKVLRAEVSEFRNDFGLAHILQLYQ
jgi:hypothetical protein